MLEIRSYVLAGQLAHRDSMCTGSVICPGDVNTLEVGAARDAEVLVFDLPGDAAKH